MVASPAGPTLTSRAPLFEPSVMSSPSRTMTEGSLSSAFSTLRLGVSRAVTNTVAPWPSPELSLGPPCSPLGRNKCWEVIGPALAASVNVLKAVKELLDAQAEYLHEKEPKTCLISFGVWMMGKDGSRACPTLLVSCRRKPPRLKAVELIRESSILKVVSGFRLAQSSHTPLCTSIQIPLGPPTYLDTHEAADPAMNKELYFSLTGGTCGISMYTAVEKQSSDGSTTYSRLGTIGGFVSVMETIYALSTAHNFIEDPDLQAVPEEETDSDFEFDDELDSEDSSPKEYSQKEQLYFDQRASNSRARPELLDIPDLRRGTMQASSWKNDMIGLDWALIRANSPLPQILNQVISKKNDETLTINIEKIADEGPVARNIVAITGTNGLLNGLMSPSPIFMMTPYSEHFQELWTIRLAGDVSQGDSGSWVIDSENGDLYGQVLYGHPGHGIAYIVPAKHISQDIEKRFGSPISLPLTPPASSEYSKPLDTLKSQVIPGNTAPGFGIIIANITIAVGFCTSLHWKCRDAGGKYGDISREILGLRVVFMRLKHIFDTLASPLNNDPIWGRQGQPIVVDAYITLSRLDELLQNRFGANIKSQLSSREKLVGKRKFTSDDMAQLEAIRVKLMVQKTRLTLFLDAMQLHRSGKITKISDSSNANQLDKILDKVDFIIPRMGQKISQNSVDEKEVWKQFRKELIAEGFSARILAQHEDVLRVYIRAVECNDLLNEDQLSREQPTSEHSSSSDLAFQNNQKLNSAKLEHEDVPPSSYSDGEGSDDNNDRYQRLYNWIPKPPIVITTQELVDLDRTIKWPLYINGAFSSSAETSLAASRGLLFLAPDSDGDEIPVDAKWTRIERKFVSPEVLDQDGERYEARPNYIFVYGILSRERLLNLASRSWEVRTARQSQHVGIDSLQSRESQLDEVARQAYMELAAKDHTTEATRMQSEDLVKKKAKFSESYRPKSPPDSGYDTGGSATDAMERKMQRKAAGIGGTAASLLSVLSEAAENL